MFVNDLKLLEDCIKYTRNEETDFLSLQMPGRSGAGTKNDEADYLFRFVEL